MNANAEVTVDDVSLQQFLSLTEAELAEAMNPKVLLASAEDKEHKFSAWMGQANWPHLPERAASQLCVALQPNIAEIFVGAWSKFSELRKCGRETLEDPHKTCELALGDHDFTYEVKPAVAVLLDNVKVANIPFGISVTFTVKAAELVIRHGAVEKVRTGKCNWAADISCTGQSIWKHQCADVDLPGALHLSRKFPLVRSESPLDPSSPKNLVDNPRNSALIS